MNKEILEQEIAKKEAIIAKLTKELDQLKRILAILNEG